MLPSRAFILMNGGRYMRGDSRSLGVNGFLAKKTARLNLIPHGFVVEFHETKRDSVMTTLDKMIRTLVTKAADPLHATPLDSVLEALSHVNADVIAFEIANKSLPSIRRRAAIDVPSVLTKGGNAFANEDSTIVISAGHLAELIVAISRVAADTPPPKPANSILSFVKSIKGEGSSIDIGRRDEEEVVGGHMRF